jgi:hypothetical protein
MTLEVCIGEAKIKIKSGEEEEERERATSDEGFFEVSYNGFERERKASASIHQGGEQKGEVQNIEDQGVRSVYGSIGHEQRGPNMQRTKKHKKIE